MKLNYAIWVNDSTSEKKNQDIIKKIKYIFKN